MPISEYIPGWNPDPFEDFIDGLHDVQGDGDAIALLPYDDGTLYPKRAYFDKDLIGGIGGYETDDGDKIAVDGTGEAVRSLFGVDIVLGVDPTEHAAAVDPVKALIAHKNDIGEWIRVDKQGTVVQAGPAIEPAPTWPDAEDADAVYQDASANELLRLIYPDGQHLEWSDEEKESAIEEHEDTIRERIEATLQQSDEVAVNEHGMVGDGGMAGELMQHSRADPETESMSFHEALAELAQRDAVTKVYDIAPPSSMVLDEDGEVQIDDATHIAVDQSKAAELLPTTFDTVELNTALDKARMEEHEEGKLMKYFTYGGIAGAVTVLVVVIIMALMFSIGGGIF